MTDKNKSRFLKDTFSLVAGNAFAQFITIALTPVITRLFSPEAFGEFSIIMALTGPFVAIASFRYHEAIMLPEHDAEAGKIFQLASLLVSLVSFIIFLAVFFFYENLAALVNVNNDSYLLYALPCLIFLLTIRRVLDSALQRKRMFYRIAGAAVSVSIIDRAVSIGSGLLGHVSASVLIASRMLGLLGSVIWMFGANKPPAEAKQSNTSIQLYSLMYVARRYREFAIYSWAGFIQQFDKMLPMIMLGSIFGVTTAGLFALARRVLIEPVLLVGEALSKTFYQKATEVYRSGGDISALTVHMIKYLFMWVFPPLALLACIAPETFALVFGEEWRLAGDYSVYLIPWFVTLFIMQPLMKLFNILEKQKQFAYFSLWKLLGTLIVLSTGIYTHSVELTFSLLSLLVVVLSSIRGGWILRQIGVKKYAVLPKFFTALLVSILCVIPVLVFKYTLAMEEWVNVAFTGFIGFLYITYMVISDPRFNKRLRRKS